MPKDFFSQHLAEKRTSVGEPRTIDRQREKFFLPYKMIQSRQSSILLSGPHIPAITTQEKDGPDKGGKLFSAVY